MSTRYDLWQSEREQADVVEHGLKVLRGEGKHPSVKIWKPKATKPSANCWFRTAEQREAYVAEFVRNYGEHRAARAQATAERNGTPEQLAAVQVGTVFVHSWGWEQTNVDFYEVVEKRGRNVVLQPIASREVEGSLYGHGMANQVVAVPGQHLARDPVTKRLQFTGDGCAYVSFEYGWAEAWDGRPMYSSWYA